MVPKPRKPKAALDQGSYTCLPPEDVKTDVKYAVSLNPCDDCQYWNVDDRYKKFLAKFFTCMRETKYAKYILYPEMSSKGRLHFHGTIEIFDVLNFYLYDLSVLRLFCQYEIDTIQCATTWEKYCTKGKPLLAPYIATMKDCSYPVIYYNHIYFERNNNNKKLFKMSVTKITKKSPGGSSPAAERGVKPRSADDESSESSESTSNSSDSSTTSSSSSFRKHFSSWK